MSQEEEHIKILNYWRQYGEIEHKLPSLGAWRLLRKGMDQDPSWDFANVSYRIPVKYSGPYGNVIWKDDKPTFVHDELGAYVLREEYERK